METLVLEEKLKASFHTLRRMAAPNARQRLLVELSCCNFLAIPGRQALLKRTIIVCPPEVDPQSLKDWDRSVGCLNGQPLRIAYSALFRSSSSHVANEIAAWEDTSLMSDVYSTLNFRGVCNNLFRQSTGAACSTQLRLLTP